MSQPLESSQLDAVQIKKGRADCNVHNKINHSFLSWKRKSQYYIPILAIVCVRFTSNSKRIVDIHTFLVQVFTEFQLLTHLVSRTKLRFYIDTSPATIPV